jgi:hypothetical protein
VATITLFTLKWSLKLCDPEGLRYAAAHRSGTDHADVSQLGQHHSISPFK